MCNIFILSSVSWNNFFLIPQASPRSFLLSVELFGLPRDFSPLSKLRYNTFSIYDAVSENSFHSESILSHNIRTPFVDVMGLIMNEDFCYFMTRFQDFVLVKTYSHTNFLQ